MTPCAADPRQDALQPRLDARAAPDGLAGEEAAERDVNALQPLEHDAVADASDGNGGGRAGTVLRRRLRPRAGCGGQPSRRRSAWTLLEAVPRSAPRGRCRWATTGRRRGRSARSPCRGRRANSGWRLIDVAACGSSPLLGRRKTEPRLSGLSTGRREEERLCAERPRVRGEAHDLKPRSRNSGAGSPARAECSAAGNCARNEGR